MKTRIKLLLVLISLSITLSIMSNTYSKYAANTTGNFEVSFSKWQILVNETDITSKNTSEITLIPVIEQNQYIAKNKVAPSSKGYFDIDIDPSNVQLSFNYKITLNMVNENIPDLMITKYSILDETHEEQDDTELKNVEDNAIQGTLMYNNEIDDYQFKPFTIRIYFEWYEGDTEKMNDEQDTEIGSKADENPLKMNVDMSFEQVLE